MVVQDIADPRKKLMPQQNLRFKIQVQDSVDP